MGGLRTRRLASLKENNCSNSGAVLPIGNRQVRDSRNVGWNGWEAFASRRDELSSNILCGGISGQEASPSLQITSGHE